MSSSLDAFADEVGKELVERHDPLRLDGVEISATVSPPDAESLARVVTALDRAGLATVPRGGGRHLALGNPPARADLFLSTLALRGVEAFEPAEGVLRARCGTRLQELRETVLAEGWELPLDGPGDATLGGALAAASVGPRSHGFGPARDAVLGLDVVLGSGERTRCGGRVVKNVTGYDLAKLYTGSLGSLCVIESAWLRLRPRPGSTRVVALAVGEGLGCERGVRAARRTTTRACVLAPGEELLVELAGDEAGVAADAAAIGGESVEPARLEERAALQWGTVEPEALRCRIAALPSELPAVVRPLLEAGFRVLVHPGPGLVYAIGPASDAERLYAAAVVAAGAASGPLRCEVAPLALKRRVDVLGASEAERRLYRALKRRFDPNDVLSPGRLVEAA